MNPIEWTYLVFGIVLLIAIIFDLGILSTKSKNVTIKKAFFQTLFWVGLAFGFFLFIWFTDTQIQALEYLSAYLMEWGLSVDNIFVFILIFSYFNIPSADTNRLLLLGILLAIILRVVFITVGIVLVDRFFWILYVFGGFLIYTGIKMFVIDSEREFDPGKNVVYRFLRRIVPLVDESRSGKFTKIINGKRHFTLLFVVLILLATTDVVFALDSIPAVFAITQTKFVIYTSNIFAVLGLRSLFFLLKGAVNKFKYLKEGIAIVLIFIGLKMLVEYFEIHLPVWLSLLVIVVCLSGAILYSVFIGYKQEKKAKRLK